MRGIVDRIEEGYAVVEHDDLTFSDIPLCELPPEIAQGDCIHLVDGRWAIDRDRTESRKRRIAEKMRRLFRES